MPTWSRFATHSPCHPFKKVRTPLNQHLLSLCGLLQALRFRPGARGQPADAMTNLPFGSIILNRMLGKSSRLQPIPPDSGGFGHVEADALLRASQSVNRIAPRLQGKMSGGEPAKTVMHDPKRLKHS